MQVQREVLELQVRLEPVEGNVTANGGALLDEHGLIDQLDVLVEKHLVDVFRQVGEHRVDIVFILQQPVLEAQRVNGVTPGVDVRQAIEAGEQHLEGAVLAAIDHQAIGLLRGGQRQGLVLAQLDRDAVPEDGVIGQLDVLGERNAPATHVDVGHREAGLHMSLGETGDVNLGLRGTEAAERHELVGRERHARALRNRDVGAREFGVGMQGGFTLGKTHFTHGDPLGEVGRRERLITEAHEVDRGIEAGMSRHDIGRADGLELCHLQGERGVARGLVHAAQADAVHVFQGSRRQVDLAPDRQRKVRVRRSAERRWGPGCHTVERQLGRVHAGNELETRRRDLVHAGGKRAADTGGIQLADRGGQMTVDRQAGIADEGQVLDVANERLEPCLAAIDLHGDANGIVQYQAGDLHHLAIGQPALRIRYFDEDILLRLGEARIHRAHGKSERGIVLDLERERGSLEHVDERQGTVIVPLEAQRGDIPRGRGRLDRSHFPHLGNDVFLYAAGHEPRIGLANRAGLVDFHVDSHRLGGGAIAIDAARVLEIGQRQALDLAADAGEIDDEILRLAADHAHLDGAPALDRAHVLVEPPFDSREAEALVTDELQTVQPGAERLHLGAVDVGIPAEEGIRLGVLRAIVATRRGDQPHVVPVAGIVTVATGDQEIVRERPAIIDIAVDLAANVIAGVEGIEPAAGVQDFDTGRRQVVSPLAFRRGHAAGRNLGVQLLGGQAELHTVAEFELEVDIRRQRIQPQVVEMDVAVLLPVDHDGIRILARHHDLELRITAERRFLDRERDLVIEQGFQLGIGEGENRRQRLRALRAALERGNPVAKNELGNTGQLGGPQVRRALELHGNMLAPQDGTLPGREDAVVIRVGIHPERHRVAAGAGIDVKIEGITSRGSVQPQRIVSTASQDGHRVGSQGDLVVATRGFHVGGRRLVDPNTVVTVADVEADLARLTDGDAVATITEADRELVRTGYIQLVLAVARRDIRFPRGADRQQVVAVAQNDTRDRCREVADVVTLTQLDFGPLGRHIDTVVSVTAVDVGPARLDDIGVVARRAFDHHGGGRGNGQAVIACRPEESHLVGIGERQGHASITPGSVDGGGSGIEEGMVEILFDEQPPFAGDDQLVQLATELGMAQEAGATRGMDIQGIAVVADIEQ